MPANDIRYQRHLPHYHPEVYPLFVNFRLADSLPLSVMLDLKKQREQELRSATLQERIEIENKYFFHSDEWLDRCKSGPRWFQHDNVAQITMDEIKNMEGIQYKLIACCIMPNHVHMLVESLIVEAANHSGKSAKYPVTDTFRLLKDRTARKANLELERTGSFWQHESYDHYTRDGEELNRTILYVVNSPVKAGLVKEWKDWKFTYINPEFGDWS
jgi:REP element-mobilizing transposase RayT